MLESSAGSITKTEVKHWYKNAFLFALPALLAFLIAIQGSIANGHLFPTQQELIFALGAGYSALLSAAIGFVKTYMSDNSK